MGNPLSEYMMVAYTLILIPFIKNMFLCCNQSRTIFEATLKRFNSLGEGVGTLKTRVIALSVAMLIYSGVLLVIAPIEVSLLYTLVATVSYIKVCFAALLVVNHANS